MEKLNLKIKISTHKLFTLAMGVAIAPGNNEGVTLGKVLLLDGISGIEASGGIVDCGRLVGTGAAGKRMG